LTFDQKAWRERYSSVRAKKYRVGVRGADSVVAPVRFDPRIAAADWTFLCRPFHEQVGRMIGRLHAVDPSRKIHGIKATATPLIA